MAVQTDWLEKDYYAVLGVPETATDTEIQRAYRKLARAHHPDANGGDAGAEERFKEISAAYDVLGDGGKRAEYDEVRRMVAAGAAGPGGFPGGSYGRGGSAAGGFPGGSRYTTFGDGVGGRSFTIHVDGTDGFEGFEGFDVSDLLGGVFGGGRAAGGPRGKSGPRRGADLRAELPLGFAEAVSGLTTEIDLGGPAGRTKVRIPAGVADGQLVRIPGKGGAGRDGGPPGDLYVTVRVGSHPFFGRDGDDLTLRLPVTYPEAVLGAEVGVPTLDGTSVTVRIPPGTPAGRVLRVRGKGVPRPDGSRGNLLVTVEVAVPSSIGDEERAAVEALAAATTHDPRAHLSV
jgi:molecular chaperone DnaJ